MSRSPAPKGCGVKFVFPNKNGQDPEIKFKVGSQPPGPSTPGSLSFPWGLTGTQARSHGLGIDCFWLWVAVLLRL